MRNLLLVEVNVELNRLQMLEFATESDEFYLDKAYEYVVDILVKYKEVIDLNEHVIEIEDVTNIGGYYIVDFSYFNDGMHREFHSFEIREFIKEFITVEKQRLHTLNTIIND